MKVNGQLEVAQIEIMTGEPALAPRARIIYDKAVEKAKLHNGTSFKTLAFESTSTNAWYNAGNSGSSITIDWANGVNQRLTLSANCLISFTGASDGEKYTLLVENVSTSMFGYYFNIGAQDAQSKQISPPWMGYSETRIHEFTYRSSPPSANNIGGGSDSSQFTFTNGAASIYALDIRETSKDINTLMCVTSGAANQLNSYRGKSFYNVFEWGYKSGTSLTANDVSSVKCSPSKQYFAFSYVVSPYIGVTTFTEPCTITSFSNPGTLPTGGGTSVDWHPTERAIIVSHSTSPYLSAYPFSSAAIGSKYANPSTLPPSTCHAVAFSPFGDYVAALHTTTPFISVYAFTTASGFGAKSADVSPLPSASSSNVGPRGIAWSPDGSFILVSMATTPFIYQIPFTRSSGVMGTPLAAPGANTPGAEVKTISFSKDGQWVFLGWNGGANIFPFSSTTGITWASPAAISFGAQNFKDSVWSNYGPRVFYVTATNAYPQSATVGYYPKNWIRINDA